MAAVSNLNYIFLRQEMLKLDQLRLERLLDSILTEAKQYKKLSKKIDQLFKLQDSIIKQKEYLYEDKN